MNTKRKWLIAIALSVWMSFSGLQASFGACENGGENCTEPPAFNVSGANVTTVDVENDTTNLTQVSVGGTQVSLDFGDGDGKDKYKSNLPPAFFVDAPELPSIALPQANKGSSHRLQGVDLVFAGLPSVITDDMIKSYAHNKTILVDDESDKRKLRKIFEKARKKIRKQANVTVVNTYPASGSIRLSRILPSRNLVEGVHINRMGEISFPTEEDLAGLFTSEEMKSLSSRDLVMLLAEAGRDCGATHAVPVGQGARTIFDANAGSFSLSGLFSAATGVSGQNALPSAATGGAGAASSSGNNNVVFQPYLTVALFQMLKEPTPVAVVKKTPEIVIEKDNTYEELIKCALPVADPNGELRLLAARESLEKYLASGKTDAKALIDFQTHIGQAIKDNIKGEKLRLAQEGVCLAWLERAEFTKRLKEQGSIGEAEFYKTYYNNLKNSLNAMHQYKIRVVGSPEDYLSRLRAINSK